MWLHKTIKKTFTFFYYFNFLIRTWIKVSRLHSPLLFLSTKSQPPSRITLIVLIKDIICLLPPRKSTSNLFLVPRTPMWKTQPLTQTMKPLTSHLVCLVAHPDWPRVQATCVYPLKGPAPLLSNIPSLYFNLAYSSHLALLQVTFPLSISYPHFFFWFIMIVLKSLPSITFCLISFSLRFTSFPPSLDLLQLLTLEIILSSSNILHTETNSAYFLVFHYLCPT